jgi:uncharacterized protein YcbK (DUF882 family)
MGDVSKHFSFTEFSCKRGCVFNAVDVQLLNVLEDVRTHLDKPVTIDCVYRCPSHNKAVGGVENSQHVQGIAADIAVRDTSPDKVADFLEKHHPGTGIGRYATFTHIGVRGYAARWNG